MLYGCLQRKFCSQLRKMATTNRIKISQATNLSALVRVQNKLNSQFQTFYSTASLRQPEHPECIISNSNKNAGVFFFLQVFDIATNLGKCATFRCDILNEYRGKRQQLQLVLLVGERGCTGANSKEKVIFWRRTEFAWFTLRQ